MKIRMSYRNETKTCYRFERRVMPETLSRCI